MVLDSSLLRLKSSNDLVSTSALQRFYNTISSLHTEPFGRGDSSVGMEYEMQVAVEGDHKNVDLPIVIRSSTYFKNLVRRTATGDLDEKSLEALEEFLFQNRTKVWENSWVRFSEAKLSLWSRKLLANDLRADKANPQSKKRGDVHKFRCLHKGKEYLRLPVSYLLKLAFGDCLSRIPGLKAAPLAKTGQALLNNFLSDNTSPEILSFTIPVAARGRIGDLAAAESARTLLFCQLLVQYANKSFGLEESGQKCLIYSAPHAPSRQKQLNEIVPDGFYRQLFISPCLSGWDRGEDKHRYMELCHKILSRSQLNTVSKLKDAGIIANNLIVLPNTSNTCLANNGTHVSLGSQLLSNFARVESSVYTPAVEKYFGDLVIKIVEHFLPLFVGTYSAAPYRIDFKDFHPEKVLGFLPHELDYTHLRMLWRRWKKKANIQFMGRTITPFGPNWVDTPIANILRLKGDLVPDFRLIDYLVTLLSTETGPALNGELGNHERLKDELADLGIFDPSISIYLPYRQRIFDKSGYSGFEGRIYSLFASLKDGMAEAVDIQNLVTALACRYVLTGKINHHDIPDNPSVESERRQVFFCSAIGIPTFYVRKDTGNRFLKKILASVHGQRNSRRYKGYIRVQIEDYRMALLKLLRSDGADLVESMELGTRIGSLRAKLTEPITPQFSEIVDDVTEKFSGKRNPLSIPAEDFNRGMERYYRTELKQKHLKEALHYFTLDCKRLESSSDSMLEHVMQESFIETSAFEYVTRHRKEIVDETVSPEVLRNIIAIGLAIVHHEQQNNE